MKYLFVGEKRSERAKQLGLTWKDGGLAAKPLFEGLAFAQINLNQCQFTNLFERGGIKTVRGFNGVIVGMGRKVQGKLDKLQIPHLKLTHPAARGSIRKRGRYLQHVYDTLK
jgi:hypothetical protein